VTGDPLTDTPLLERTTAAVLAKQVARRPDAIALVGADGTQMTYQDVGRRSQGIASGFRRLGVSRHEMVLLFLDNHLDNVLAWLGTTVGAMVSVPINSAFKGEMLAYVINESQASVIVIEGGWIERLTAIADQLPLLQTVVVRGGNGEMLPQRFTVARLDDIYDCDPQPLEPPAVWDLASMLFTSGTEGRSKGVLCPHGHAFSMACYPPLQSPDEVVLVALPLFHAAGLWAGVYNALRCGATAVVMGQFSVSTFWEQVRGYRCTTTILMGGMLDFLGLAEPTPRDRDHTLSLAAVLPAPRDPTTVTARFGFQISSAYGLTEAGTVVVTAPGHDVPGSCGTPRPFIELRLVGDHDEDVPPGTVGEIVLRSNEPWSMMLGYHQRAEATVAVWRNLWLHTGDAAWMDPDTGHLFYVDRRKDSLRRRGENVSSFEVEQHILERSEIVAAAVVAVAGEHTEDELKAVLVLREGASFDPNEMLRDLYHRMPYFMVPRYFEVVDSLPRTPTHKVMKHRLRTAGVTAATWDATAAGFRVTRHQLVEPT
jgi:crotonobetaine/carnitine-CoA ligase